MLQDIIRNEMPLTQSRADEDSQSSEGNRTAIQLETDAFLRDGKEVEYVPFGVSGEVLKVNNTVKRHNKTGNHKCKICSIKASKLVMHDAAKFAVYNNGKLALSCRTSVNERSRDQEREKSSKPNY